MGELFGNVLLGIAQVLNLVVEAYIWVIIIRSLLSFVNPDPFNPIVRFLNQITDPVLFWVRRKIPTVFGGFDISPLLVILVLVFLQYALIGNLFSMAAKLGAGR